MNSILLAAQDAISQGILWSVMALGIYITYRLLNIADLRLVNFINDIMMANFPKIYRQLKKYLVIENEVVKLRMLSKDNLIFVNETESLETIRTLRDYIKEKFMGTDNMHQFMSKFLRYYKEELSNRYISDVLVNHFIDYTTKRIQLTLEQNEE